jgi:hypothetical protein
MQVSLNKIHGPAGMLGDGDEHVHIQSRCRFLKLAARRSRFANIAGR